ncbi:MAG: hypothetical protein IPL03_18245 [Sterolibacteriaceae bacterium]|nr:hypothetical protein [Candidatus Methylophosphatis haderslevensis]
MLDAAVALDAGDPRRVDLQAWLARELEPAERRRRSETILRDAIAWAEYAEPAMLAPTIGIRLRLAEALDASGDAAAAQRMLLEWRERAATADDCRCELVQVVRAQAWYHLQHGEATQALQVLEASPFAAEMMRPGGRLGLDYGWALLQAGRHDDAVAACDWPRETQSRTAQPAAPGPVRSGCGIQWNLPTH